MDSRLRTNKHGWNNHQYIALKLGVEQYKANGTIDFENIRNETGEQFLDEHMQEAVLDILKKSNSKHRLTSNYDERD